MSNYEKMYWIVYTDGLNRIKCAGRVCLGVLGGWLSKFIGCSAAGYMAIPILWFILALYTRSHKTNVIFGFDEHPGYATMKLLVFLNGIAMYYCAMHGHILIDVAECLEDLLFMAYAVAMMYHGIISIKINKKSFDKVFFEIYGSKTNEDIEAEKRLFKNL